MKDKVKACPGKELKQMSTEQLDVLLQTELKKELPDESIVMPILQELQEREKDYPVMVPEGLNENMAGYRDRIHITTEKPNISRKRTLRIVAVAALVCIVLMAIPRTVGAESVFQVLYRWTGEFFEFLSPEENRDNPPVEYQFVTDNGGLQQLYDVMVSEGVAYPVVPMWLPEGYELAGIKRKVFPDGNKVAAEFGNGKDIIIVSYRICADGVPTQYEKEAPGAKLYEVNGVSHFVFVNNENTSAAWAQGAIECGISSNLTEQIIHKIIASIYRSD